MDTITCGLVWWRRCPQRRRQQQQRTFRFTIDQQSSLLFQQYIPDIPDLAEFGIALPPAMIETHGQLHSKAGRDVTISLSHNKTHMIMRTDVHMFTISLAAVHAELGGPACSYQTNRALGCLPGKMSANIRELCLSAVVAAGQLFGKRYSGKTASQTHSVLICGDLYQAKSRKEARSFVEFISKAEQELMQRALERGYEDGRLLLLN